jgi:hypothetical protein
MESIVIIVISSVIHCIIMGCAVSMRDNHRNGIVIRMVPVFMITHALLCVLYQLTLDYWEQSPRLKWQKQGDLASGLVYIEVCIKEASGNYTREDIIMKQIQSFFWSYVVYQQLYSAK